MNNRKNHTNPKKDYGSGLKARGKSSGISAYSPKNANFHLNYR
jgi:hypothetical protein